MPVVSVTGHIYTPVITLPGKQARYRKRNDRYETPHQYLPLPRYLYMCEVAGMDSEIFFD